MPVQATGVNFLKGGDNTRNVFVFLSGLKDDIAISMCSRRMGKAFQTDVIGYRNSTG